MTDGILFDLDGTLANTLKDIATAMNHALDKRGLQTWATEDYRAFVSEGAKQLVELAAGFFDPDILADFRAYYADHIVDFAAPYPGVIGLLGQLEAAGTPLAVLSNKPDRFVDRVTGALFPEIRFVAVRGERPGVPRKPNPAGAIAIATEQGWRPARCVFVGDSDVDMKTARRAGMASIGVTWGFRSRAQLEAAGAERVVSSAEDLADLLPR